MQQGSESSIAGGVGPALAAMRCALDELTTSEWWSLSAEELAATIGELHRVESRVVSAQVAALGEAIGRGLPADDGAKSGAAWLRGVVPITPGTAGLRAALAQSLGQPELAPTRAAFAAGEISASHAGVVARTVSALTAPGTGGEPIVDEETRGEAQSLLVRTADRLDPAQLGQAARHLRHRLHPDGAEQLARDEDAQERAREACLFQESTGMWRLSAQLPAISGAMLAAALDPLARPEPATDGTADPRSARQRTADALVAVAELSLAARPGGPGALPTRAGAPSRLNLTGDLTALVADLTRRGGQAGIPPGVMSTGEPGGWLISPLALQVLACDAEMVPMLLDAFGRPLDVGDTRYPFPPKIRKAIEHRDRHCTFPGCGARPAWCHTHHLTAFSRHGPTSEANGTLLCGRHHRYVHAKGWIGELVDGHVFWRRPDPDAQPVGNAYTQEFEQALRQLAIRWLARNPQHHDDS